MTRTCPQGGSPSLFAHSAAAAAFGAALLLALPSPQARAAGVANGDFETGDFTGWTIQTDAGPGQPTDLFLVASQGGYAARIEADYYATPADVSSTPTNAVFIANTLHQGLDLSAQPGEQISLGFDWSFGGEDGSPTAGDVLVVGLTDANGQMYGPDGQPGYVVVPRRSYGSGSFQAMLDPAVFNNATGWSLEVQLLVGVDPYEEQHNALGSYVEVDNVTVVPEPGTLAGLGAGAGLLFALRRRQRAGRAACGRHERSVSRLRLALAFALVLGLASSGTARAWTDVSGSAVLTPNLKAFDLSAGVLFSNARVTNQSGGPLQTLRLVVTQPSVPVTNPDGFTGAAEPYFDVPELAVGESASVRIEFPLGRFHLEYGLRLDALLPGGEPLAITTAPGLTMDPNGLTPLAGLITATTNIPARVTLTATSTSGSFVVEFHEFTTDHSLPLLGLRTDSSYTIDLTFTDPDGNSVSSGSLVAVTGPLPGDAPDIDVMINVPGQREPGYTWLDRVGGYAFVFDQDAEVVWYSTIGRNATRKLQNGHLQWQSGVSAVDESDLLGNLISQLVLQLPGLPESQLHHELFATLYGTFLSLDREDVVVDDYPTSSTDPNAPTATVPIRDNPIVEFRGDGTALKRWPLVDLIQATRVNYNVEGAQPIDWAHANAVVQDPRDDSLIASVRHQDCIIKVDRVTGRLKWILGNPSNWTPQFDALRLQPVGPLSWQYHEHGVKVVPNGHLLLFDNGNNRSSPFDPTPPMPAADSFSRAVEFAVDEENMEVSQVWEWSEDDADRIFSRFLSDADALPLTGNVLIDFGGVTYMGGVATTALGYGANVVRLIEVTHETPGQVVLDILVSHPTDAVTAYRAEHWSSLYPPDATRTDL